ncbi:MAG: fibronectin type III domain-containing protein [Sarcina sp.]
MVNVVSENGINKKTYEFNFIEDKAVDYSILDQKLKVANDKLKGNYTDETLTFLNYAINYATEVRNNETSTQYDVDSCVILLDERINGLVEKGEEENNDLKPDKVSNLIGTEVETDSLRLTWNKPTNTKIASYTIYKDGKVYKEVTDTEIVIDELKANTIYSFKVVANGANTQKSSAASINVRTLK